MKKTILTAVAFILGLHLTTAQNWWGNGIKGTGPSVTKTLNVSNFEGIALSIDADVKVEVGNSRSVKVEGQQNIIDLIETTVESGVWKIKYSENVGNHSPVKISIVVPALSSARISGSGDISGSGVFRTNTTFVAAVSGSGNLTMEVEAPDVDGKISGSGNIQLAGTTGDLNASISGSGDFKADRLQAKNATVRISGSGDCDVRAGEDLNVSISGSGDVTYRGRPSVKSKIVGSGDVTAAN